MQISVAIQRPAEPICFTICLRSQRTRAGLEVAGKHIPGGYSIGMNAAVVGYDEDVYGPDAHTFQPKRWLGENASAMNKRMPFPQT